MKRRNDYSEFQGRLLQCAESAPVCERISSWVLLAVKPGSTSHRTDFVLMGSCDQHRDAMVGRFGSGGYADVSVVEWEGVGVLLRELDDAGLLERIAS